MFNGLSFPKRKPKSAAARTASGYAPGADPPLDAPSNSALVPPPGAALVGATVARGIPLDEYAKRHAISESEVWRQLRAGELLGRSDRGQLMILDEGATVSHTVELPPLPNEPTHAAMARTSAAAETSSEVALLLDHLSLAKEENREILKMTQEAIRRVTELTDSVVAMKNAVIEAKDTQIDALREQLSAREERIRQLLQKTEDLEMLARALSEKSSTELGAT